MLGQSRPQGPPPHVGVLCDILSKIATAAYKVHDSRGLGRLKSYYCEVSKLAEDVRFGRALELVRASRC